MLLNQTAHYTAEPNAAARWSYALASNSFAESSTSVDICLLALHATAVILIDCCQPKLPMSFIHEQIGVAAAQQPPAWQSSVGGSDSTQHNEEGQGHVNGAGIGKLSSVHSSGNLQQSNSAAGNEANTSQQPCRSDDAHPGGTAAYGKRRKIWHGTFLMSHSYRNIAALIMAQHASCPVLLDE